jgi:trans-aconitate 2-methyltransferase
MSEMIDLTVRKEFSKILSDYEFFQLNSSEENELLKIYTTIIKSITKSKINNMQPYNILDFGCGNGQFFENLIKRESFQYIQRPNLSLVEPDFSYKIEAIKRLSHQISPKITWLDTELKNEISNKLDLIISNHVLYYVQNINDTVSSFLKNLAVDGTIIITMAEQRHPFNNLLEILCNRKGFIYPYFKIDSAKEYFDKNSIEYQTYQVNSELKFPVNDENFNKIINFILGKFSFLRNEELISEFKFNHIVDNYFKFPLYDQVLVVSPK